MRLLSRYVLREFLVPLGFCLAGFVSLFVLFELFGSFGRIMSSGLPAARAVEYFLGFLSPYVRWLVPAALMLATLYTMWNFCRHSEIVAMRASGIGFFTIARPILLVSVAMAVFVAWVDEVYAPAHAQWAMRLKGERFSLERMERSDGIAYRNSRDGRVWTADSAEDSSCRRLLGVKIAAERPSGARMFCITAARADWLDGEWWLTNASVQHYDGRGAEIATPTPELDALPLRVFPQFSERPGDILSQNRNRAFGSVADTLRFARVNRDLDEEQRRECLFDAWAQALAPLACLVMTLFAVPAGISSGRQSVFLGVLGALAMFFSFYALYLLGMVAAYRGWIHHVPAAVAPHAVFLLIGAITFRRCR